MSAFKIRHKKTGKFLSTTAGSRYFISFYMNLPDAPLIETALTKNGKVYSTRRGAQKKLDSINRCEKYVGEFELYELQ